LVVIEALPCAARRNGPDWQCVGSTAGGCLPECEVARTVVIVDDDSLVVDVTADMPADLGREVATAAGGHEALARISENRNIEILITNLNVPGKDGYEVAERARGVRGDIRIILLSGGEVDGRGLPIVRKPFPKDDLAQTMRHMTGLCWIRPPYFSGGFSGLSVQPFTAGDFRGSNSSHCGHRNSSRRLPLAEGTSFIGLPQGGQSFRL
jgi:two-component system cell cycle response regulator CpdR